MVGAYHPGCLRGCVAAVDIVDVVVDNVLPEVCCGVRGMSLPRAKTGVSGNEQDVCIPEFPGIVIVPINGVPIALSVDGDCRLGVRLLDGPGKSVGRVRRSTGTYEKITNKLFSN